MTIYRATLIVALLTPPAAALATDNYLALDGNRNPITFRSKDTGSGQVQQTTPSDATGAPFGQANPQYFNLLIGGFLPTIGQANKASSIPVAPPADPDVRPSAGTISAADINTVTTTGQNGSTINTGGPTPNSSVIQAINGISTSRIQLSGVWLGAMALEQSIDGATTFGVMACHVNGAIQSTSVATANGIFDCDSAGATHVRVRATSLTLGIAVVSQTYTALPGVIKILNSVALKDNLSGNSAVIKSPSAPAVATDPAIVVVISPNSPVGVVALGSASTDQSGTITAGGSFQTVLSANPSRKGCNFQNPTTATEILNVKFGGMSQPFTLLPGMSIGCSSGNIVLTDAVSVSAATTGHAFSALSQ